MLKALILSQRRSGSTFGVKTTKVALGLNLNTQENWKPIRPYQRCEELLETNYITLRWKLWRANTHIIKIEEPSSHLELVDHLLANFPRVKAITTIRNIESLVASRMALKQAWGRSTTAEKVIQEWVAHYHFLEDFIKTYPGKLFIINIDQPQTFNASEFCRFLNVSLTPAFQTYSEQFLPVNTLDNQARKHGLKYAKETYHQDYSKEALIELFPDLPKYEILFQKIFEISDDL